MHYRQLLKRRLDRVWAPKRLRSNVVYKISKEFCIQHIQDFELKMKRKPLVDEVFDPIAGTLIDVLRVKIEPKVHKIAKFVARVFCDLLNEGKK